MIFSLPLCTYCLSIFYRSNLRMSVGYLQPVVLKSSSICYVLLASAEKYCGALLLFHKITFKLNPCYTVHFKLRVLSVFPSSSHTSNHFHTLKLLVRYMDMFRPIRSVMILVINKSDSRCAVVRFCYHSYDCVWFCF